MVKCADCGRFISHREMQEYPERCEYEPLSEHGPESIEWVCGKCADASGLRDSVIAERLADG